VLQAGDDESEVRRPALEKLCQSYWYPIYVQIRRRGYSPHDAEDLTQGFFASLLGRAALESVSREKGRFRSFLLAALGHYLSDQFDRRAAVKRGGALKILSLDETVAEDRYRIEPAGSENPERDFDRHWAITVMESALEKLGTEQQQAGKQHVFERLCPFLTDGPEAGDYTSAAAELNIPANTVAVTVRRLRQRYREIVRKEIAETLANPADVERETAFLLEAMRG
jgi:RNA polymerase sigma factor (sigma-70 family)